MMGKYYIKTGVNVKNGIFQLPSASSVLRSKQVSGRRRHHSVNVRGSFKLSTGERTVLPPGAVMPQVTLWRGKKLNPLIIELLCYVWNLFQAPVEMQCKWARSARSRGRGVHDARSKSADRIHDGTETSTQ